MECELYLNKAVLQKNRRERGKEGGGESVWGDRAGPLPHPHPVPPGRVVSVSESHKALASVCHLKQGLL